MTVCRYVVRLQQPVWVQETTSRGSINASMRDTALEYGIGSSQLRSRRTHVAQSKTSSEGSSLLYIDQGLLLEVQRNDVIGV